MAIADVNLTIQDGALGTVPINVSNTHMKMGISSQGVPATIYAFSDMATLKKTLGFGPLVDSAALALSIAGGPIYCVPLNPGTAGSLSAVTKSGTGSGTLTVAAKNWTQVLVKIITAGATGVATFVYSLDGGATFTATSAAQLTGAGVKLTGAPQISLTFTGAGSAFVAGDLWTITNAGVASLTGTGTGGVAVAGASPVDAYSVIVTITTAGNLGVAFFTYSLDGGNTQAGPVLIPSGGIYVLPNTGIVLTFGGTAFGVADSYTFTSVPATYANTDVNNAFAAVFADQRQWFMVHLVGQAASVSAAVTSLSNLDSQMSTAATANRYVFALMESPQDTDSNQLNASTGFGNATSTRVAVGVGFAFTTSTVTGTVLSRSSAWHVAARLALVPPQEAASFVNRGALVGIPAALASGASPLSRDENVTQGLDAGRFCTLRTLSGRQGFYITQARIMAPNGSDFQFVELRRVMDIACNTSRQAFLPFLNGSVRINPSTGIIDERDARRIETEVNGQLGATVVGPGMASSSTVTINRAANLLSTSQMPATVRIVPLGYIRGISEDIGFLNPATKLS